MAYIFFPSKCGSILFLIFCLYVVIPSKCKITSLNNKYSPWQTLQTLEMKDDIGVSTSPLHSRMKRDAKITPHKIILSKSILQGTEKTNQAFVHWIGKETSEKVIVLTCQLNKSSVVESQLWRSDDYGSSFKQIKLDSDVKISYFYTFPTDSKKLLFTDVKGKKMYTTEDELLTPLKMVEVPIEPDHVLPHPADPNKILIYSFSKRELYLTQDFAKSWSRLSVNVLHKFYWGVEGYDDDTDMVHMEVEGSSPDKAEYKACTIPKCNDMTSKMGFLGPFMANTLLVHKEFIFVQKANLNESDTYLMVSYMRQPFARAYFPGNVKTTDFMLLSLDDGQVFVAVIHETMVNLYLSDPTGHFFVLSFTDVYHVVHPYMLEIDLHEVQGMKWTFIVNKRVANVPNGVQSYISFDKGGNWGPIPLTKELKKLCKSDDCYLQLNVKPSFIMTPAISSANAPGIIIAHGILISTKDKQPPPVSVFTSRDGGWTWKKAPFQGNHILNILDQGSVLTAIPDGLFTRSKSKNLYFSCNEGETWTKELFDNVDYMVNGVLTEPGILTLSEMLFGHEGSKKPWALIKLNFTKTLAKKCVEDDYESWFPEDYNDVTHNNCTMGKMIEYKRRKQNANCYNGVKLIPRLLSNDSCECTREDFECDFGYEEVGTVCSLSKWFKQEYLPVTCKQGEKYQKTKGYRKVSADVCLETAMDKKKYGTQIATCDVVKPYGVSLVTHSLNVAVGKEVTFYLDQAGGSVENTTYTWDMGDGSPAKSIKNLDKARQYKHTYYTSGHLRVNVQAQNIKGTTVTYLMLHVQERLSDMTLLTPLSGKVGVPVTMNVLVSSQIKTFQDGTDHVHYIWTFGDEEVNSRPLLTWDNNVKHTYDKKGTYQLSVEAVNSLGTVYKQYEIQIYEDAEVLVLTFEGNGMVNISKPFISMLLLRRLRYQLSDDLGLKLNRIETTTNPDKALSALLHIYSSDVPGEESVDSIKTRVIKLVSSGNFGFNLLGKRSEGGVIVKVTSAVPYSQPPDNHHGKGKGGPNLKGVYIGVPVLFLAVVVTIVLLCYCRRKHRAAQQYSMLHIQDDSDALLDDEDDPPLDLNIEFRGRDSHRDEPIIMDSGGSHLVMQDNIENC